MTSRWFRVRGRGSVSCTNGLGLIVAGNWFGPIELPSKEMYLFTSYFSTLYSHPLIVSTTKSQQTTLSIQPASRFTAAKRPPWCIYDIPLRQQTTFAPSRRQSPFLADVTSGSRFCNIVRWRAWPH